MARRKKKSMALFEVINAGHAIGLHPNRTRSAGPLPNPEPWYKGLIPRKQKPIEPVSAADELARLREELGGRSASSRDIAPGSTATADTDSPIDSSSIDEYSTYATSNSSASNSPASNSSASSLPASSSAASSRTSTSLRVTPVKSAKAVSNSIKERAGPSLSTRLGTILQLALERVETRLRRPAVTASSTSSTTVAAPFEQPLIAANLDQAANTLIDADVSPDLLPNASPYLVERVMIKAIDDSHELGQSHSAFAEAEPIHAISDQALDTVLETSTESPPKQRESTVSVAALFAARVFPKAWASRTARTVPVASVEHDSSIDTSLTIESARTEVASDSSTSFDRPDSFDPTADYESRWELRSGSKRESRSESTRSRLSSAGGADPTSQVFDPADPIWKRLLTVRSISDLQLLGLPSWLDRRTLIASGVGIVTVTSLTALVISLSSRTVTDVGGLTAVEILAGKVNPGVLDLRSGSGVAGNLTSDTNNAVASIADRGASARLTQNASSNDSAISLSSGNTSQRAIEGTGRISGLNYVIIQAYDSQAEAQAVVELLAKSNITATVEFPSALPKWAQSDSGLFFVVGTQSFNRFTNNPAYADYIRRLNAISGRETGKSIAKAFDPHAYQWRVK